MIALSVGVVWKWVVAMGSERGDVDPIYGDQRVVKAVEEIGEV